MNEQLSQDLDQKKDDPRIFEVGNNRIIDLSQAELSVHPVQWAREAGKGQFSTGLKILSILGMLLLFSSGWIRAQLREAEHTVHASQPPGGVSDKHSSYLAAWIRSHPILLGCTVVTIIGIILFQVAIIGNAQEEPFSIFEGISAWPTEVIRFMAIVLAAHFLLTAVQAQKKNRIELQLRFFGKNEENEQDSGPPHGKRDGVFNLFWQMTSELFHYADYSWTVKEHDDKKISISDIWKEYLRRCKVKYLLPRLILLVLLYLALGYTLVQMEVPLTPVRGPISRFIDGLILASAVLMYSILTIYVFDESSMCRRFIQLATGSKWDNALVHRFCLNDRQICSLLRDNLIREPDRALKDWMLIHLIADRTEVIGRLLYYPLIIWIILFISRLHYFDDWHMPIGLRITMAIGFIYSWISVYLLRNAAEWARKNKLHTLRERLARATLRCDREELHIQRLETAIREISEIRRGAFAPFTAHPLFQVLMPFAGGGAYYVIEFLRKMNF